MHLDVQATPQRLLPLDDALAGLLAGAAVGRPARTWVRVVTTGEVEPCRSGTLLDVGAGPVMGGATGVLPPSLRRVCAGR